MRNIYLSFAVGLMALTGAVATAAEGKYKPYIHPEMTTDGIFGYFDQQQLQRGYQVYREVCAACHAMDLVAFRHLAEKNGPYYLDKCPKGLGIPESTNCSDPAQNPIVQSIAAEFMIQDGPDDAGDMFDRPGLPSDYFPSPYPNKQAAQAANGGAYPPDMSLITKARKHGAAYVYSLLMGYEEPPAFLEIPPTQYYNVHYKGDTKSLVRKEYLDEEGHLQEGLELPYGGVFKMAAPLNDNIFGALDLACEELGDPLEQCSRDVTAFLMWTAEPKLEQRKTQGRFVILYLFIFAAIVYVSYRQIWRNVH